MNIRELQYVFQAADKADDSVIVESVHGVGKSDSVKQFAREHDYFCQELFLSMMDVGDVLGIPRTVVSGSSTVTIWAEPIWFKRIRDAAWPEELEFEALNFIDKEFEKFVNSELNRS